MADSEAMDVDNATDNVQSSLRKPRRGARNKKANWRNKIDLADVEESLEQKRKEEVLFGKDVKDLRDDELFTIDKRPQKKEMPKKATYVDRLLENKSKVPPPMRIESKTLPKKVQQQDANKLKHRLKTVHLQSAAAKKRKTVSETIKEQTSLTNSYDLWGSQPTTSKKFSPAQHAAEIDGRARTKRPAQMKYKPDMASKVASVVPAHAGASYNPDFDSHQSLLREEAEKTLREKKVRNKYFQKAKPAPIGERVTAEDIVKESMEGLGILPESEEEYEDYDEEEEEKFEKAPIRAEDRKSKKQRLKERKVLKEQTRARRRKRLRVLMNQIYEVKRIKKELRAQDAELEKRRIYRKEKLANQMPRLGWIKYQKPDQELKLSSELTGTLRQLVPEGNVLSDRHESFLARTMMEPRLRRGKQKLKFRPKWQQKRSFREFGEKMEEEIKKEEKMEQKMKST